VRPSKQVERLEEWPIVHRLGSGHRAFQHPGLATLWTTYVNHGTAARGRDFVKAVRLLAGRAGVDRAVLDRAPTSAERRSSVLETVMEASRRELASQPGTCTRAFLLARGIPNAAIQTSGLGVVPERATLQRAPVASGRTQAQIDASRFLVNERWPGRIVGA
jgi:hypothetical protein